MTHKQINQLQRQRMTDGTGHVDSEWNGSIAQLSSNESALHLQKRYVGGLLLFLEKKYIEKKRQKLVELGGLIGFETHAFISYCLSTTNSCNLFSLCVFPFLFQGVDMSLIFILSVLTVESLLSQCS